jgi:orotidine-5'-phosphate decarboxylase
VIGVTVLTSADQATLAEVGFDLGPELLVQRLAVLADASGMDGVVASPRELSIVRTAVKKPDFVVVTPGVRPTGSVLFDQKRVTTPREAVLAGADYVVVGRPILDAPDPVQAAQRIVDELEMSAANSVTI